MSRNNQKNNYLKKNAFCNKFLFRRIFIIEVAIKSFQQIFYKIQLYISSENINIEL